MKNLKYLLLISSFVTTALAAPRAIAQVTEQDGTHKQPIGTDAPAMQPESQEASPVRAPPVSSDVPPEVALPSTNASPAALSSAPSPTVAAPTARADLRAGGNHSNEPTARGPTSPVPTAPVGHAPLESGPAPVKGKWNPTLYGFIALDMVHDSTQSLTGASPGFLPIARPGTYQSQYGRTIFDVRGSRFGFRLAAPEMNRVKATALIEVDFIGNQPATAYPSGPTSISEYSFSTNPLLRVRHAALKVETPVVDLLVGQYWQLFGWQPYFFPLTAQMPSFPGEVYSRAPQVRLSHKIDAEIVSLEAAMAAARPPQRNTDYPDAQAGLRLLFGRWKGVLAAGFCGPYEQAAGVGVSGVYREFRIPEFTATPTNRHRLTGKGISVDALLPVIPRSVKAKGNALTLTGSFAKGTGISDLYSPGVPGNAGFPALPNPTNANPAPVWPQDIDNGLVTFDATGQPRTIDWQMYVVGGQYYVPPSGRVWLGANYGHAESKNLASFGLAPNRTIPQYDLWDAVTFIEITQPVIAGFEYARTRQIYADGVVAKNTRLQMSFYFVFY